MQILRDCPVNKTFGNYRLDGRFLHNSCGMYRMLAIHGARSNHITLDPLLLPLQALEIGSLSFDLSGHTEHSPLKIDQTSLAQNLFEAKQFAKSLDPKFDTIFGHSLGGALAMKVAEYFQDSIQTLILSCPALYPEAAYSVKSYGKNFTEAISKPFGFLDSLSLQFLRQFKGNVILIVGEYDGLRAEHYGGIPGRSAGIVELGKCQSVYSPIPAEVFEAIQDAAGSRLTRIQLDQCDHRVFSHLIQYPQVADTLAAYLRRKILSPGSLGENFRITTGGALIGPNMPDYAA